MAELEKNRNGLSGIAMDPSTTIEIRIRPDGQVYFHGTSEELFEIAVALCPNDPWVVSRADALSTMRQYRESIQESGFEHVTQGSGE